MSEQDTREKLEADMRTTIETLKSNSSLVDFLSGGKHRGLAEDIGVNAWELEQLFKDLLAEYDRLREAIDAMNNGQFYSMYKAKCDECEQLKKVVRTQADSFKKLEIELAGKDG